jgi:hypothetical protein
MAQHLSYSSDSTSSDFLFFGEIKHYVQAVSFCSEGELLLEIHDVLKGISSVIVLAAFGDSMERLVSVTAHEGHYNISSKVWPI